MSRPTSTSRASLRALYDLGLRRASGRYQLGEISFELREGGLVLDSTDAVGRRGEALLTRISESDVTRLRSIATSAPNASAVVRTLSLIAWVRRRSERDLDVERAAALRDRFSRTPIALNPGRTPRFSDLEPKDGELFAALARPRTLSELASLARAPRFVVLSFVAFLDQVGALTDDRAPSPEPTPVFMAAPRVEPARARALRLLGLPIGAETSSVKAAFRRLARTLHPDVHPAAGEAERRRLAQSFAAVSDAYTFLVRGA